MASFQTGWNQTRRTITITHKTVIMILRHPKYLLLSALFMLAGTWACKDNWEEHNEIDPTLGMNVLDQIKANPDLSIFAGLIAQAGLESLLESSNSFTVWAPVNSSLENLSENIINDDALLKQFVTNHIAYQNYFTHTANAGVRVKMVNGKYQTWTAEQFEGVSLVSSDQYAKNGVLHVINDAVYPLLNSWEYLRNLNSKYGEHIKYLDYKIFVDSLAVKTGVDPITGIPTYEPGTGYVTLNTLLNSYPTLDDENAWTTVLVLTDEAFDAEIAKVKPFFKTVAEPAGSERLSASFVMKELFFEQLYTPENIPAVLLSKYKVSVPIDKAAIVETHKTSNGIVYVMNKIDFNVKDIIKPIIIEGEWVNATSLSSPDRMFNVQIRNREYASQGLDLRVSGHNLEGFNIRYLANIYSVAKYDVYWVANNDFQGAFTQRIAMDTATNAASYINASVGTNNVSKIKAGDFYNTKLNAVNGEPLFYRTLKLYLIAPTSATPLVLDRIELVPVY